PLALEPVGRHEVYGEDRCFYAFGSADQLMRVKRKVGLSGGAHCRERVVSSETDLAVLLYDWMIATAVAGAILGVNPFDQPNVQQAKDIAKAKLKEVRNSGSVGQSEADASFEGVKVFGGSEGDF